MKKVILEIRVPVNAGMSMIMETEIARLPGFNLDENYHPIPLHPSKELAAHLVSNKEETVVIRGELEEPEEHILASTPNVISIWTDGKIQAVDLFDWWQSDAQETHSEKIVDNSECCFSELLELEQKQEFHKSLRLVSQTIHTPCPPTDCQPSVAKGTIGDVINYLRCDRLWEKGIRGAGIVIGICGTGVDKSKIPAVIGGWTPNPAYPPGTDPGDHGTMCAAEALAVCPDAKIYDIGIGKSTKGINGFLSDAIAGYHWVLEQYRRNGTPQILADTSYLANKSGAPDYAENPNHPFSRKVAEIIDAGITVVFRGGNCGEVCSSPQCGSDVGPGKSIWGANGHPKVITVGAANIQEQWIGYTSQGPAALDPNKPDFCAPSHFKGYYTVDSGTAVPCALCAGVIGLLKSHFTDLTPARAKEALQKTAKNLCATGWDPNSGYGMIQAEAAFNSLVGPSVPIAHANWVHGTSVEVEYPDRLNLFSKKGFYTIVEGKPDTTNWFHFALPTPVIVDNKRWKLESVILMFVTQPDAVVTNVHIYEGHQKIEAFDGLSMTGSHLFERFDVLNLLVRYGIGISIGVRFGKQTTNHLAAFISAGGDFIE
jgi:hypothetical protein